MLLPQHGFMRLDFHLNWLTPWSRLLWEANSQSASQEVLHLLWNLKVYYHVHKSPSLVPILSQVYAPSPHLPILLPWVTLAQELNNILAKLAALWCQSQYLCLSFSIGIPDKLHFDFLDNLFFVCHAKTVPYLQSSFVLGFQKCILRLNRLCIQNTGQEHLSCKQKVNNL
jgi:hypothetical protein